MALGHWAVEYLGEGNGQGGSGGGGLVVHVNEDEATSDHTLDKTWQEIYDALAAGRYVLILIQNESSVAQTPIDNAGIGGAGYCVYAGDLTFKANSADGYPSYGGK